MGEGHELLPFLEWQQRALDYAAAHPKSPLARIAAVVDDLADEEAAAGMLKGLPTGGAVFGGDVYPAPLVDEQLVRKYRDRINFVTATTSTMNGSSTNGANGSKSNGMNGSTSNGVDGSQSNVVNGSKSNGVNESVPAKMNMNGAT
jgi:hypothetical protein